MDKVTAKRIKAHVARSCPAEALPEQYLTKALEVELGAAELTRRLRIARFLCDKSMRVLTLEMDVRGAQESLEAMEKVGKTRQTVNELLEALEI